MYHAGERHGRAYVWPRVRRGCEWLAMAHGTGDPAVGEAEQMWVYLKMQTVARYTVDSGDYWASSLSPQHA